LPRFPIKITLLTLFAMNAASGRGQECPRNTCKKGTIADEKQPDGQLFCGNKWKSRC
jgi:hypothetical protein